MQKAFGLKSTGAESNGFPTPRLLDPPGLLALWELIYGTELPA